MTAELDRNARVKLLEYQKVMVLESDPDNALHGKFGIVVGFVRHSQMITDYAVYMEDTEEVVCFKPQDLHGLDEYSSEGEFYSGESIRVSTEGEIESN